MGTIFRLKNNDVRSFGFSGRLCVAGSGNRTPPEAARVVINGEPFRLPPLFEMNEEEMFRSFRGVLAGMATATKMNTPAIEVFVEGVATPLTAQDIESWVAEYRDRHGLSQPKNRGEVAQEIERAMNRAEDPIERQRRLSKAEEQTALIKTVTAAVLAVLRPAPEPAPAAPVAAPRGRNDEAPEETPPAAPDAPAVPQGRARPRS